MPDSAYDYQATVQSIAITNQRMVVKYESVDSGDGREPIYQPIFLSGDEFNDSDIQARIKQFSGSVVDKWISLEQVESDNSSFSESDFVGDTYSLRFKPTVEDPRPNYNVTTQKLVESRSEDSNQITIGWTVVALDSAEMVSYNSATTVSRGTFYSNLLISGSWDSASAIVNGPRDVHASWDASAGAAFDFSTDAISSHGVKSVTRVSEGRYRVVFDTPFADANYTALTGVGAEDYSGAGGSPRQVAVISRAVDSMQVLCERTDDAVNEDNAYFAVKVEHKDSMDANRIDFMTADTMTLNNPSVQAIQTGLGLNDSDMSQLLYRGVRY